MGASKDTTAGPRPLWREQRGGGEENAILSRNSAAQIVSPAQFHGGGVGERGRRWEGDWPEAGSGCAVRG